MKKSKKGIILPYILWSIMVLTIFSLMINLKINTSIDILRLKKNETDKELIVSNLVSLSMAMTYNDNSETDSFLDQHIIIKSNLDIIPENYSLKYKLDENSEEFLKGLCPCNSKLNLNYINNELKNHLIETTDFSESQWSSLFDWIDSDNDPYNNGNGVENEYYESLNIPYKARNAPIENWEELYLIKEMNDPFFNYLNNKFTIYGNGKININTVSIETLLMLGFSEVLAEKLISFLAGYDEKRATDDDVIIKDIARFIQVLTEESIFSAYEISELKNHLGAFTVKSNYYHANIYLKDELIAKVLINRGENKKIILESVQY